MSVTSSAITGKKPVFWILWRSFLWIMSPQIVIIWFWVVLLVYSALPAAVFRWFLSTWSPAYIQNCSKARNSLDSHVDPPSLKEYHHGGLGRKVSVFHKRWLFVQSIEVWADSQQLACFFLNSVGDQLLAISRFSLLQWMLFLLIRKLCGTYCGSGQ